MTFRKYNKERENTMSYFSDKDLDIKEHEPRGLTEEEKEDYIMDEMREDSILTIEEALNENGIDTDWVTLTEVKLFDPYTKVLAIGQTLKGTDEFKVKEKALQEAMDFLPEDGNYKILSHEIRRA